MHWWLFWAAFWEVSIGCSTNNLLINEVILSGGTFFFKYFSIKSRSGYAAFELYNSIDRELSFYGVLEEELWYGEVVVLREEI